MGSLQDDPVFELVEDKVNQPAAIANSRSGPQEESVTEQAKRERADAANDEPQDANA